jgi:hypothetical protein
VMLLLFVTNYKQQVVALGFEMTWNWNSSSKSLALWLSCLQSSNEGQGARDNCTGRIIITACKCI